MNDLDVIDGVIIGLLLRPIVERILMTIWTKLNQKLDEWANIS